MNANERPGASGEVLRTVSVSGYGEVDQEPTIGQVSLGVNVVRRTADDAMGEAARLVEQLRGAIIESGIARDDITTSRFTIRAEYDHSRTGRSTHPVGFRASHTVKVRVREIDRTGEVVGTAVKAGANTIESVSFIAEDYDEARGRARDRAFEDARRKAEQIASLSGATLGRVLSVTDGTPAPSVRYTTMRSDALYQLSSEAAPSFDPEDLTIGASLSIVWELE